MNKTKGSNNTKNTDTDVKSCSSCKHDPEVKRSIDDAPIICWNCINTSVTLKFPFPMWTPKNENLSN